MGRHHAEMVRVVVGDDKERRERKDGGEASAQSGANDEECGRKYGTLAQDLKAYNMEKRTSADSEERRRCKVVGPL